jgi:hypothetical protein
MYDIHIVVMRGGNRTETYTVYSFDAVKEQHKAPIAMLMAVVAPEGTSFIKGVGSITDYGAYGPLIYLGAEYEDD